VPAIWFAMRIARRTGLRGLFTLGCVLLIVSYGALSIVEQPAAIVAVRAVAGAGGGSVAMAAVLTMGAILPAPLQATGQALFQTAAYGIAAIVANATGGVILAQFGYVVLFAACTVSAVVAIALGWLWCPRRGESFAATWAPVATVATAVEGVVRG
jgi:MFS transporter, DHA2 family, multidrug resistance protein